jgi:hypothetical protein
LDYFHWRRSANTMDLLDLENSSAAWFPTRWQRDLFPPEYREPSLVLHPGVNTRLFAPHPGQPRTVAGGPR